MANVWVRRLAKITGYGFLIMLLLAVAITFTVGWRPVIGAKKRALTSRKFEVTPERMRRGDYLVHAVMHCMGCHSNCDEKANPPVLPPRKAPVQFCMKKAMFAWSRPISLLIRKPASASGATTPSPAPSAKASPLTEARCFLSCPTSTSATCPTKTWLLSWSSSAACRRRTAICLRTKIRFCSPASSKRRRSR